MEIVVLKILFIVSVSAQFGKHVYVEHVYKWPEAQKYCRDEYTDLSPITTWRDEMRLKKATIWKVKKAWIGLYKDSTQWKWSGGGNATYIPWDAQEPDDIVDQMYASVCWHNCGWEGWHNEPSTKQLPFFCFNLIVMEDRKTWEKAIHHCRRTHTTLTSLASETEHLLALSEIQHDNITERVWIGLRYLADGWMWVDGEPLVYEAWSQGDQDNLCPLWKRCGTLTKAGLWESWDCRDQLNFICY